MSRLIFLDTETTSLDSNAGDVWEIGLIVREDGADPTDDRELLWHIWPDLTGASPDSLRICRFYQRIRVSHDPYAPAGDAPSRCLIDTADDDLRPGIGGPLMRSWEVAKQLARLVSDATIVGAVPDFDARFLTRFLARHGQAWTAHYHLIDVEPLAVGYLAASGNRIAPPWRSDQLTEALGLIPPVEDKHTALGDARWARSIYDRIMTPAKATPPTAGALDLIVDNPDLPAPAVGTHAYGGPSGGQCDRRIIGTDLTCGYPLETPVHGYAPAPTSLAGREANHATAD